MRVQSSNKLREPRDFQATQLVVYDSHGRPMVAIVEQTHDVLTILTRGMPEFEALLHTYGIDRGTQVVDVGPTGIRL